MPDHSGSMRVRTRVPSGPRDDPARIFWNSVAPPGDVQIRTDVQEIAVVDLANMAVRHAEHLERDAELIGGPLESAEVVVARADLEQRVSGSDPVVQRRAIAQPEVGEPSARPGLWLVALGEVRIGPAGLRPADRRLHVAVPELDALDVV